MTAIIVISIISSWFFLCAYSFEFLDGRTGGGFNSWYSSLRWYGAAACWLFWPALVALHLVASLAVWLGDEQ